ncbi:ribosomal RNA-processing protein 7-domain-containing protein [Pavlovales sp. CCMP2436]|nr:ribosomal RNA-processing protein 7-domain-containing protein [Pavlovales sp. CCMP2436]
MPHSVLVVFKEAASLPKALEPAERALSLLTEGVAPVADQARPEQRFAQLRDKALKAEANAFMLKFDEEQAVEKEREAQVDGVPDADGFVTVTRASKRPRRGEEGAATGAEGEQPTSKKNKGEGLTDFYHFQRHERKREHLVQLRQRFEQDKERIASMKSQRRFRPE